VTICLAHPTDPVGEDLEPSVKRLILIDVAGLFRAHWASMGDLEVSEALHRTVERVHSLSSGYDYVAVCCDWPPYRRAKLLPEYKGHRSKPSEVMVEQYLRTKERLVADGYLLWEVPGFEADDCIATAVQYAKRDELDVTVASSDKDLLCLVDDAANVRQLVTSTGEVFRELEVTQKFGVPPKLIPDLLALMGDKSDNIPGITLVGLKNGAALLRDYGNAENVWECRESIKGKLGENIRAHGIERLRLAMSLVKLETDVPIDWDAIYVERKPAPAQPDDEDDNMSAADDDFENDLSTGGQDRDDEPTSSPRPESGTEASLAPLPPPPPQRQERALAIAPPPRQEAPMMRAPVEYSQALEPMDIRQAFALAKGLMRSRLYSKYPNEDAALAVILRGREMGLGALTSLDAFHVVEGKPTMSAHLIIARAKEHHDCEYFQCTSASPTAATWKTKNRRNPEPTEVTYTIKQAEQAGLLRRGGNWTARPEEMLVKTAGVILARREYPSAALGLYCPEEMGIDAA
jgi:5'-3' exonuclease